jgi:PmbA protein
VLSNLKPQQAPSYKGKVLLSPRAIRSLMGGLFGYHASGRQVMDGKSRWQDMVGKAVGSSLLTIEDRPHDARLTGATSFDGDGLPTANRVLLDKGVLQCHLQDSYSAKKLGTQPNGCAGAPFGMVFQAGTTPLNQLLKAEPALLLVDRFSGNTDPVKGDFSGVAKNSRLIRDGKDHSSVTETMIAGNMFEIFKQVVALSVETESDSGSFIGPYILVDGISVTGQ